MTIQAHGTAELDQITRRSVIKHFINILPPVYNSEVDSL
jgi:hypothetical protein